METPRKFIIAKRSVRKLGSLSVLIILIFITSTDEDSIRNRMLCNSKFTWFFDKAKLVASKLSHTSSQSCHNRKFSFFDIHVDGFSCLFARVKGRYAVNIGVILPV